MKTITIKNDADTFVEVEEIRQDNGQKEWVFFFCQKGTDYRKEFKRSLVEPTFSEIWDAFADQH